MHYSYDAILYEIIKNRLTIKMFYNHSSLMLSCGYYLMREKFIKRFYNAINLMS